MPSSTALPELPVITCKSSWSGKSQQLSIGASRLPFAAPPVNGSIIPMRAFLDAFAGMGKGAVQRLLRLTPIELSLDDRASKESSVPQSFRHSAPDVASDAASAPTCWISDIRTDANPR